MPPHTWSMLILRNLTGQDRMADGASVDSLIAMRVFNYYPSTNQSIRRQSVAGLKPEGDLDVDKPPRVTYKIYLGLSFCWRSFVSLNQAYHIFIMLVLTVIHILGLLQLVSLCTSSALPVLQLPAFPSNATVFDIRSP